MSDFYVGLLIGLVAGGFGGYLVFSIKNVGRLIR